MKDNEKKVNTEENAELTEEELEQVTGGGLSLSPPAIEDLLLDSNASLTTSLR